jgi:hypothetical protein
MQKAIPEDTGCILDSEPDARLLNSQPHQRARTGR